MSPFALDILEFVQSIHSLKFQHMDLKVDNILIDDRTGERRLWLIDFGTLVLQSMTYRLFLNTRYTPK